MRSNLKAPIEVGSFKCFVQYFKRVLELLLKCDVTVVYTFGLCGKIIYKLILGSVELESSV